MNPLPVYMDYSATTPCDERVLQAMLPYFTTHFGNATSRSYSYGWLANSAVENARVPVANLIGANPDEIVFTSGATEACNLAIRGVYDMYASKGNHIITTKVEHKTVLNTCKALQKKGADVTYLEVDENGLIQLETLHKAIKPATILVAIMLANNETGVIMPVKEIGALCRQNNVLFFTDATQAAGKIRIAVNEDKIDLLAFSSHKIYGPKGVGALYIRNRNPRVKLIPQITGGGQENDRRSGTLNVPGIVGFGEACTICSVELHVEQTRTTALRERLEQGLLQIPKTYLNGALAPRLPGIINISFKHLNSSQLIAALHKNLAVSTGSACTTGSLDPSYVLNAMHIEDGLAKAALRFSLGRFTTGAHVDIAIKTVKEAVAALRAESFEWQLTQRHEQ